MLQRRYRTLARALVVIGLAGGGASCKKDEATAGEADTKTDAKTVSEAGSEAKASNGDAKADAPKPSAGGDEPAADEAPALEPEGDPSALRRATEPLAVKTKVKNNPGFKLEPLLQMHALAASPAGPSFAGELTGAQLARDDDLGTAATCVPSSDEPCAIGLVFDDPAQVTMLRVYLTAGPKYLDYKGAPRPKTLVVHTDAGSAKVTLKDGAEHQFVVFEEPVATKTVSLEVADVYPGRKDERLHFGEIEAYGTEGKARAPLSFDPTQAYVYFETQPWKDKGGGRSTVRMTWIETLGAPVEGEPRPRKRWIRGAAVYGKADDRFYLLEKVLSSTCDAPAVSYVLVDKQTRMLYPLAAMAGGGASIHRHGSGMGFLAVPAPGPDGEVDPKGIRSVLFDPAKNELKRERGKDKWSVSDHLGQWGFDAAASDNDGVRLAAFTSRADSHCEALEGEAFAGVLKKTRLFDSTDPGQWWTCDVGGGNRMLVGRDAACGEKVAIFLAPPDNGDIVALSQHKEGKGPRRIVVRDDAAPGVLVEVGTDEGGGGDLIPVGPGAQAHDVVKGAGFVVRPPAGCGACLLHYGPEPSAEEPAADGAAPPTDEPAADDGEQAPSDDADDSGADSPADGDQAGDDASTD